MRAVADTLTGRPFRDGFVLDAEGKSLPELMAVASAALRSQTRVEIRDTRGRSLEELMRLAVAGGDCVIFGQETARSEAAPSRPPRRRWFSR